MKKILIIFLLIPFLLDAQVRHYVSTSGTDSGTGHTQGAPWATLTYAEANATTAGDTICLKKGDTWTVSTLTGITISHGGTGGTYITWDGSLWGSGANAIIQATSDDVDAVVRIAACDYVKFQRITIDGNDQRTYGLVIGGDINNFGSPDQNDERYITVQYCNIYDCGDQGVGDYSISLLCQTKSTDMYNISVQYDTIDGNSNHGIAFYNLREDLGGEVAPTHDVYIGYNYVTNCGKAGAAAASSIMLTMDHLDPIIEHNTIRTGGDGLAPGIALGCDPATILRIPTRLIVRYNDVVINNSQALFIQNGGAITCDIYYNILHAIGTQTKGAVAVFYDTYTNADIDFFNNVMIQDGNTYHVFESEGEPSGIGEFRNNICVHTGNVTDSNVPFKDNNGSAFAHSNNLFHRTLAGAGVYFAYIGANHYTRADIATWEATVQEGDPLFDEVVANFDTLWLKSTSPCDSAGIFVGINYDYRDSVVNNPPSIGAYEVSPLEDESQPDLESLTTAIPTITYTRLASGGGSISTSNGTISARGICWSTSPNPTTSDSKTSCGTGTGSFTGYITGLKANTTYYVQAYATNETGTSYGGNQTITTPAKSYVKTGGKYLKIGGKYVILH